MAQEKLGERIMDLLPPESMEAANAQQNINVRLAGSGDRDVVAKLVLQKQQWERHQQLMEERLERVWNRLFP